MTEKQYAPSKTEKKATQAVKTAKKEKVVTAQQKEIKETPVKKEEKITEKKENETKEKKVEVKKIKKVEAVVNSFSVPVSTKTSSAICRFIKGKTIEKAMQDLDEVIRLKKAVPMKGEIPHRKGRGMMSGRFPMRAAKQFVTLLKSLKGNSNVNELDSPVISEAMANIASRPYGRFGRTRKKRTHITLKAKEKKLVSKDKKSKEKKK